MDLRKMNEKKINYEFLKLFAFGILIGIFAGGISTLYRCIISFCEKFLMKINAVAAGSNGKIGFIILMFCGIFVVSIITAYIKKWVPLCGGSGIPQVKAEIDGKIVTNPVKVILGKIIGGTLSALCGMSVGREGPSIQLGAMTGKLFSKFYNAQDAENLFLTGGAAAGLSAAFNAPIASVMFSIEEIHGKINKRLTCVILTSAITADFLSKIILANKRVFNFELDHVIQMDKYYHLIIFGVIISILGIFYLYLMEKFSALNDNLKMPFQLKMLPYFAISALVFLCIPYISGGGGFYMSKLMSDEFGVKLLIALFFIKLFFSIISFTSGIPGGIFFPILVLGANIGMIYGKLFYPEFTNNFMILGMAGMLTAVVRSPVTSVLLIYEMTGNITFLLPLGTVSIITYIIPNFIGYRPVYDYLYDRVLLKNKVDIKS